MAEAKRLKRYGPPPSATEQMRTLERRLAQVEASLGQNGGGADE